MFDDFSKKSDQDGKRFGVSLVAAAVIFSVFGGGMVAATAAVKTQQAEEELVQVEFAPPPEPEPEAPPPEPEPEPPPPEPEPQREPPQNARQRVQRDDMRQPDEISDEELDESDEELVDAESTGPQGGFLDGVDNGTGNQPAPPPPPPPPPPEPRRPRGPVMRPERAIGGETIERPSSLEYPQEAQSAGIQGVVIVKCVIDLQGRPKNCESLRGHDALVPAAIRFAERHRFSAVRLPDGTPIEVYKVIPVRFRLTNM